MSNEKPIEKILAGDCYLTYREAAQYLDMPEQAVRYHAMLGRLGKVYRRVTSKHACGVTLESVEWFASLRDGHCTGTEGGDKNKAEAADKPAPEQARTDEPAKKAGKSNTVLTSIEGFQRTLDMLLEELKSINSKL